MVILLATDGSEEARITARLGAGIADATGSELHLVYVLPARVGLIRWSMSR